MLVPMACVRAVVPQLLLATPIFLDVASSLVLPGHPTLSGLKCVGHVPDSSVGSEVGHRLSLPPLTCIAQASSVGRRLTRSASDSCKELADCHRSCMRLRGRRPRILHALSSRAATPCVAPPAVRSDAMRLAPPTENRSQISQGARAVPQISHALSRPRPLRRALRCRLLMRGAATRRGSGSQL